MLGEGGGGDGDGGGRLGEGDGGGGDGGGGLGDGNGRGDGGEEGGVIPTSSRQASSLASSFSSSAEHSQVDGAAWNGEGADDETAAAPTQFSTQSSASHLSR